MSHQCDLDLSLKSFHSSSVIETLPSVVMELNKNRLCKVCGIVLGASCLLSFIIIIFFWFSSCFYVSLLFTNEWLSNPWLFWTPGRTLFLSSKPEHYWPVWSIVSGNSWFSSVSFSALREEWRLWHHQKLGLFLALYLINNITLDVLLIHSEIFITSSFKLEW